MILENNVRLHGRHGNVESLIRVLNNGAFTMEGGEISGNEAVGGGGVYIASGGIFTKRGGEISGNRAMGGGGVAVAGTFTMENGLIRNNVAYGSGGGVTVRSGGIFTKWNGEISGNSAARGGGVHLHYGAVATFTMHNGRITDNRATVAIAGGSGNMLSGGGVSVVPFNSTASFIMAGGQIHSNSAIGGIIGGFGGGVFAADTGAFFQKTGGSIQANASRASAGGPALTNQGNEVFAGGIGSPAARRRENAVWDNLSFDSRNNPPTYSGVWD